MSERIFLKPEDRPGVTADGPTHNRVEIVGYLGDDAELRYTQAGVAVTILSVATHRLHTARDGQLLDITDWHRVVTWNELAEPAGVLGRGALVKVVGQLRTRTWETAGGERRWRTEVVADQVQQIRAAPRARQQALPLLALE